MQLAFRQIKKKNSAHTASFCIAINQSKDNSKSAKIYFEQFASDAGSYCSKIIVISLSFCFEKNNFTGKEFFEHLFSQFNNKKGARNWKSWRSCLKLRKIWQQLRIVYCPPSQKKLTLFFCTGVGIYRCFLPKKQLQKVNKSI